MSNIKILGKDVASILNASDEDLKKTDMVLVIDRSGSMSEKSSRPEFSGQSKYKEVEETVRGIAARMEDYDDDGLTVISFAADVKVIDGVTSEKVAEIFRTQKPGGTTALHDALTAAVEKARSSEKEHIVVMIFTDGCPNSKPAAKKVLHAAAAEFGRPKIAFVFVQVGKDEGASEYLEELNSGLGSDVDDIVAALTEAEAELLDLPRLVWLGWNA